MKNPESLIPGNFYHIYNRGINGCDIFRENENYEYFLKLYEHHISPIADTYAWVLMRNHFHLLVRIHDLTNLSGFENLTGFNYGRNLSGHGDLTGLKKAKPPHKYFSNLFNAYAKAFNKRYNRHGSLFERPFSRKRIHHVEYLRNVVLYIHDNPVHHHFCEDKLDYPWSSYLTCITIKPTRLKRDDVIGWFDSKANFKTQHYQEINIEEIEKWLGL